MKTHFKITRPLLTEIRQDLERPHPFAWERVGFIFAGVARVAPEELLILANAYSPVADEDYLFDRSVGAMMGSAAIRKALQTALQTRTAAFHVHMHGHDGRPGFSQVDLTETAKFVPDFFKVGPQAPHGALVLSHDSAVGQVWLQRGQRPLPIDRMTAVGLPLAREGVFQ